VMAAVGTAASAGQLHAQVELNSAERATLLAVVHDLFPHPRATQELYRRATDAIAARCRRDPRAMDDVIRGAAILERNCPGTFPEASPGRRIALLAAATKGGFFHTVYGEAVEVMYGSREAWRLLG
jgi:hypothetical protein